MKLNILGCHAGSLRWDAFSTAQVLEMSGRSFLIDCGEATQIHLRKNKIRFTRIEHVFISHLHGDHYFGLIGLVSTFQLLGRNNPLTIYGPKGIKEIIELQLDIGGVYRNYPLNFVELDSQKPERIYEDEKISVDTIPLDHRVYCNGFLFRQKPGNRRIHIEAAEKANINQAYFNKLKQGFDVPDEAGNIIANSLVTLPPYPPKSYAFCSDTAYNPQMLDQIKHVEVLYHESTFLEAHKDLCEPTKHSTAKQAAQIAKDAQVQTLILGHYSGRYKDLSLFKEEAQEVFPKVLLAEDGKEFLF